MRLPDAPNSQHNPTQSNWFNIQGRRTAMRRWGLRHLAVLAIVGALVGFLAPISASAGNQQIRTGHCIRTGTNYGRRRHPGVATALLGKSIVPFVSARPFHADPAIHRTGPGRQLPGYRRVRRAQSSARSHPAQRRPAADQRGQRQDDRGQQLHHRHQGSGPDRPCRRYHCPGAGVQVGPAARGDTSVRHHVITISRVGLRLTKTAATALNGALGTTVFAQNLFFGTARTKLVVH